jgi:hypothetical protein
VAGWELGGPMEWCHVAGEREGGPGGAWRGGGGWRS